MLDKRLIKEIEGNKTYFALMILYGFFSFLFSLLTALALTQVVTNIFIGKETWKENKFLFLICISLVMAKALITFFFQKYFKVIAHVQKNKVLLHTVGNLLEQGPIETKKKASGNIVASWVEAADQIEPFYAEYLPQFFAVIISVPLLLVIAFVCDWVSACIMLFTGPLLPFFLSLIGVQSKEANEKRLLSLGELGDGMLDFLNGIKTLKMFHAENEYRTLIAKNSENFRILTMQVLKIAFLSAFVLEFAATISIAVIAVSLGLRLMYGKMEFEIAFLILMIAPDYYMAIRKFGAKFHTAMGAKAAADILYQYRDEKKEQDSSSFLKEEFIEITKQVDIRIEDVSYQYEQSEGKALKDITLEIKHNQMTAIVGKSGSGKSTLAYALMGYIAVQGKIYWNQYESHQMKPEFIRRFIGYIPQKPHVFRDTFKNNILQAKPEATEKELWEAIEKAGLTHFVNQLPQGLNTMIAELGTNISIGEAQRIGFARVYLKNCPILIMDETTSALDEENEYLLRETFEELRKNKTVFVIAHRLETVKTADMIYVLEEGTICEKGNHHELLSIHGTYEKLVQTWEEVL